MNILTLLKFVRLAGSIVALISPTYQAFRSATTDADKVKAIETGFEQAGQLIVAFLTPSTTA